MIIFGAFAVAFFISVISTFLVIRNATRLGIVDYPEKRVHPARLHTAPVARGGGIPVFIALLICILIFLKFDPVIIAIVIGATITLIVGILDDRREISPIIRLIFNSLAGLALVISGVSINFLTNPLGSGVIDLTTFPLLPFGITLVWLVFTTNIVSWSSGVDGQLAGFVPIAAATVGALSLRFAQDLTTWPIVILSAIVAGSYLGLLFWSSFPQKIMPGYSGGALAGFLLGTLAILSGAKLATIIIVLGIPFMDASFTIIRRIAARRSPFEADRGHLHHRLLELGLNKPQVALFYWLVTGILGFLVLHLNSEAKFYTIIMLAVLVGGLLVWLTFGKSRNLSGPHTG